MPFIPSDVPEICYYDGFHFWTQNNQDAFIRFIKDQVTMMVEMVKQLESKPEVNHPLFQKQVRPGLNRLNSDSYCYFFVSSRIPHH